MKYPKWKCKRSSYKRENFTNRPVSINKQVFPDIIEKNCGKDVQYNNSGRYC